MPYLQLFDAHTSSDLEGEMFLVPQNEMAVFVGQARVTVYVLSLPRGVAGKAGGRPEGW